MAEVMEYNFQDYIIKRPWLLFWADLSLVTWACTLSNSLINHIGVSKLSCCEQSNGEDHMAWKETETLKACQQPHE